MFTCGPRFAPRKCRNRAVFSELQDVEAQLRIIMSTQAFDGGSANLIRVAKAVRELPT
jgi:hypothetical protein